MFIQIGEEVFALSAIARIKPSVMGLDANGHATRVERHVHFVDGSKLVLGPKAGLELLAHLGDKIFRVS